MKKTLAGIVLSCVLAASLTACGGSEIPQALPQQKLLQQQARALEAATTEKW